MKDLSSIMDQRKLFFKSELLGSALVSTYVG